MIENLLTPYICPRFINDEHYRKGHIHILAPKQGTKVLGLHTPDLKLLAKQFIKNGQWQDLCAEFAKHTPTNTETIQDLCHEERMIWGLLINYAKVDEKGRFSLIIDFLPAIDNWAICDNFCCNSSWVKKSDKNLVWNFLEELYAVSPESKDYEFTLRVAIVLSMCHFLDNCNYERTFSKIENLHLQENAPYYVRMAVAWLLATALSKYENETRTFVKNSTLPNDIKKLYIRKARESRLTKDIDAI